MKSCRQAPKRIRILADMPLAGVRAGGGRWPAESQRLGSPAARVERCGSFTRSGRTSGWALEALGMVRARSPMASSGGWSSGNAGEVAPVGIGRGGGVCKLRDVEAELIVGSAWAEEGCRGGSMASFELVGA